MRLRFVKEERRPEFVCSLLTCWGGSSTQRLTSFASPCSLVQSVSVSLQHLVGEEGGIVLRPVDEQEAEEDDEGHGEEDGAVEDVLPYRELPHQLDITVQYNTALDISANRSDFNIDNSKEGIVDNVDQIVFKSK